MKNGWSNTNVVSVSKTFLNPYKKESIVVIFGIKGTNVFNFVIDAGKDSYFSRTGTLQTNNINAAIEIIEKRYKAKELFIATSSGEHPFRDNY